MANVVESIDNKLGVYVAYLEKNGYDQANLEIILRDKKDAITRLEAGGRVILPGDLSSLTILGNPPNFVSAYGLSGDRAYGMIFTSMDTAIKLTMAGDADKTRNPLMFMHIIQDKIGKILVETRDGDNLLEPEMVETPVTYNVAVMAAVDQIDSVLYNFLTDRPILIVGPVEQAVNILIVFLMLVPAKYRGRYGYSINMPYFPQKSINFAILDDVPQYSLEDEVNIYLEFDHSLVNLFANQSFGDFTCGFTREIIDKLQTSGDVDAAAEIVETAFALARDVQAGESAQAFGDRKSISYDNADLVLDIATKVLGGN